MEEDEHIMDKNMTTLARFCKKINDQRSLQRTIDHANSHNAPFVNATCTAHKKRLQTRKADL